MKLPAVLALLATLSAAHAEAPSAADIPKTRTLEGWTVEVRAALLARLWGAGR